MPRAEASLLINGTMMLAFLSCCSTYAKYSPFGNGMSTTISWMLAISRGRLTIGRRGVLILGLHKNDRSTISNLSFSNDRAYIGSIIVRGVKVICSIRSKCAFDALQPARIARTGSSFVSSAAQLCRHHADPWDQ